ncbi:MAG: N-acetyltransferase family protein [Planctomycetaceae bacterium]
MKPIPKMKRIDLQIREYSPDDRETCLAIFDTNRPKYFAEHEREEFAGWLDKTDRPSYSVLELTNEVVACGGIYLDEVRNQTGLAWGMVRSDLHSQGIGRVLTELRVQQMQTEFPTLKQCLETSQHTFQFYEKMGFQTVEITPDGFGPGIDRYDMVRQ